MDILKQVSGELNISIQQVKKVCELFDTGATVPFVARYRKEATGNLDEVQLINIQDRRKYWTSFAERQTQILKAIDEKGKLSPELKSKIENATGLAELEDLYLPYKEKRKTKGEKAIEQGLKPLAIFIQKEFKDSVIENKARGFVGGEVNSGNVALDGAVNILAEWIAEDIRVRQRVRDQFQSFGMVESKVKRGKKNEGEKYANYFGYSERLERIPSHRILAMLRGEKDGILNFGIEADTERAEENIQRMVGRNYAQNGYTKNAIKESYKRVLQPSFESEFKKELKERADIEAISVFAQNLRQLLLQSPLGGKNILALDPGFYSGCKVAVLNRNGVFIQNETIFPHPPQNKMAQSEQTLLALASKHKTEAIAIGNGTAGLETERMCKKLFKDTGIQVFLVNEAGASIYSASEVARDEFPDLDLTVRGAISIGRRLIDPLAELVKIDAKSIGVGQYQHDVNQPLLKQKLNEVVSLCVNHVGVDLNTASYPILAHVSGLGTTLAKNIVAYREENGDFKKRAQLLKVPKMGKKTFEQAAGFLRIENGANPLDNTIIHPESYTIVEALLRKLGKDLKSLDSFSTKGVDLAEFKNTYDPYTVDFIVAELQKPTRDPRSPLEESEGNNIESINDLKVGMKLNGTVNNITNFGAFVDIGIKESGLVHISEISNTFVKDIHSVVALNQKVSVKVLEIDLGRKRVALSMK